jgi:molybdenum cofactor synthesis domain-containing protein
MTAPQEAPVPADADGARTGPAAPRRAFVLVASTRAASGAAEDRTGPVLRDWLTDAGWACEVQVVSDGEPVGAALQGAVIAGFDLVVTTGGTGISPTDATPEMTAPLHDRELPGLADAVRRRGADAGTPTAVLSRGLAGVAGRTLVVNLPGSPGAVRDGIAVLDGVLPHAIAQLRGEDHPR